jgi:hypothetical protein
LFGGIGGSGSRVDDSGPPLSIPEPSHGVPIINEEHSEKDYFLPSNRRKSKKK